MATNMGASESTTKLQDVDVENPTEAPPPYQQDSPGYGTTDNAPPSYEQAGDPTAAPPSYESLYGRVKAAKQESSGVGEFMKKFFGLLLGTLGCTVCLGVFLAIPVAMIVIGALKLKECDAEPYIPIYLIVAGAFGVVKNLSSFSQQLKNKKNNDEESQTKTNPFDGLLNCFLLAWFIAGNYWIYHVSKTVQYTKGLPMYCDRTLYLFAFWVTTVSYIFIALVCLCICCAGCIAGVVKD